MGRFGHEDIIFFQYDINGQIFPATYIIKSDEIRLIDKGRTIKENFQGIRLALVAVAFLDLLQEKEFKGFIRIEDAQIWGLMTSLI